jgi:hypothetical protein
MTQTHGVLDYASPPKRPRFQGVAWAFVLLMFATCGASSGITAARSMFPPLYESLGCIALQAPKERVPLMPPQWKIQSIVATALRSTRQAFPAGQLLPSSLSEALSHATLFACPHTNLVAVTYAAHDPVAAQCMASAMFDLCLATPATDSTGARLVAQSEFAPTPVAQPLPSKMPFVGGSAGAALGFGICLILMRLQRGRARPWHRPNE